MNVLVRDEQRHALHEIARRADRSFAWVVREAIDQYIAIHNAADNGLTTTIVPKRKGRG
jgi:predicted transcriptional regulator